MSDERRIRVEIAELGHESRVFYGDEEISHLVSAIKIESIAGQQTKVELTVIPIAVTGEAALPDWVPNGWPSLEVAYDTEKGKLVRVFPSPQVVTCQHPHGARQPLTGFGVENPKFLCLECKQEVAD